MKNSGDMTMDNIGTMAFMLTCIQDFEAWWKEHRDTYMESGVSKLMARGIFESGYESCAIRIVTE
jgi:hypothetical protein